LRLVRVLLVSDLAVCACWKRIRRSYASCSWLDLITKSCSSGTPISTGLRLSYSLWSLFLRQACCADFVASSVRL
ncbi:unnamed protein product, partial [Brassica oleracea var. botrytis]